MINDLQPEGNVGFFGPWVGEFGWELMTWQGWCRKAAKKFKRVYVCSFPDMAALYQDFAIFVPHAYQKRHLDWRDVSMVECYKPDDVTQQIIPFKEYKVEEQEFIRFGDKHEFALNNPILTDIDYVIHPRAINKGGKNYPYPLWLALVQKMVENGDKVASVGTHLDECIAGTVDCRSIPLKSLMGLLASSRMVVGQSSGLMHLATLCGAPAVVWGDSRTYFNETLEKRYQETWNPFRTPVSFIFDDKWQPDPELVWQTIKENDPVYHNANLMAKTLKKGSDAVAAHLTFSEDSPVKKLAGKVDPDKNLVKGMYIPVRFSAQLETALKSEKYFITLSWQEKENILKHHYASNNFPNSDYLESLEHILEEVKKEPVVKKKHVTTSTLVNVATEKEEDPEVLAQGLKTWR